MGTECNSALTVALRNALGRSARSGEDAHILTEMVKTARTGEVKVKGAYD